MHWSDGVVGEAERALEGWRGWRCRECSGGMEWCAMPRVHWRDGVVGDAERTLEGWRGWRCRESTVGMESYYRWMEL